MLMSESPKPNHVRAGKALVWVLLLLVVAGGAAAVWYFLLRGPGPASAEFNLVPRDATGFATVRVAEVAKSPVGKQILESLKKDPKNPLAEVEEMSGLKPEDVERATMVFADAKDPDLSWAIISTAKAYDKDKIIKAAKTAEEKEHQGKKYHTTKGGEPALLFISDKVFVMGTEKGVKKCLEQPEKPKSGPLDNILSLASDNKNHIAAGGVIPPEQIEMAKGQVKNSPFPVAVSNILEAKTAFMTANLGDRLNLEVGLELPDGGMAKSAAEEINALLGFAKLALAGVKQGMLQNMGEAGKPIGDEIDRIMNDLKAKQDGKKVVLAASVDGSILTKAAESVKGAAATSVTQNNFKQITLAMLNLADNHGGNSATHAIYMAGKPLLSWRVAILPYIEQEPLYRQIHLNEPWDSEHNKQFWNKMPKIYEMPGLPAEKGMTAVQVFTGMNTPFQGDKPLKIPANITDGTSQTIMIVEGRDAVNWMEPKDIALGIQDWENLRSKVGNRSGKGTLIGLWDGSVRTLNLNLSNNTFKAAITPSGNEPFGPDW